MSESPILVVLGLLLAMAFPWGRVSSGAVAADDDLAGTYECQGTMANGRIERAADAIVETANG
jgi:hypothetical protein